MTLKKILFVLSFTAAAVTAAHAYAKAFETEYTYYTDATYSQTTGSVTFTCEGQTVRVGSVTNFYRVQKNPCCGIWDPMGC